MALDYLVEKYGREDNRLFKLNECLDLSMGIPLKQERLFLMIDYCHKLEQSDNRTKGSIPARVFPQRLETTTAEASESVDKVPIL